MLYRRETYAWAMIKARELAEKRPGLNLRTDGGPSVGWQIVIDDGSPEGEREVVYAHKELSYCSGFARLYRRLGT